MDEQQRKAILKETFDMVSGGYDSPALRFFPASAKHMTASLGLLGDEHVLDVACGTGNAALALAQALPNGRVTAVDFSPGMLERARRKASSLKIGNIEFVEGDMQNLMFQDTGFDVAVSAFGIFFVENMDAQLLHIASVVKPGGRVMISCFQEDYFHPLKDLFAKRLVEYGVQMPPQTWKRIATEAGCRELFERAGLTNTRVEKNPLGYYLTGPEQWWEVVWNAGFRRLVGQLVPEDQDRFKREHLAEVEALRSDQGIWLDVGVLLTVGTKAV